MSDPDAVVVEEFMRVVERGSVQHLASRVRGRLRPGATAWDALGRLFPAVTASGLPKAPACAAISRHEGARGLYSGAVLTVDHTGALDAALVLRAIYRAQGRTWLRAGPASSARPPRTGAGGDPGEAAQRQPVPGRRGDDVTVLIDGALGWPDADVERYRREGYWGEDTLGDLLGQWAGRYGDAVAVVAGPSRRTYAELDRAADARARSLRALGIAEGDRVVVHLPNTAEFPVTLFGLLRAGAVPVLTLPAHRQAEIEHLAALSGAVAYVGPDVVEGFDHRELALQVAKAVPSLRHLLVDGEPLPGRPRSPTCPPAPPSRSRGPTPDRSRSCSSPAAPRASRS
ncbi:chorismate-binding protein [Pseudonocardia sp. ICBG601]|uniref:chorismate-binding protein n=1 Tax=Pseudonocardia sp. ICBG601 TaxID=2846759 RepID=UPI0027E30B39|nr:chorismate-binding protein [Pseudonocardia sp. ICBG601]